LKAACFRGAFRNDLSMFSSSVKPNGPVTLNEEQIMALHGELRKMRHDVNGRLANIVAAASDDPAVRTRIFATIDLAIGILTLIVQFFATGKLIARFGVGPAAGFLAVVFGFGFAVLAMSPVLAVVIAFQAIQRTANFAVSNPAREVLFTVVEREEKYKAKNVIDIVVFRGADAVSGWLFAALRGAGLELSAVSLATVPVAAGWFILALALGRTQERRARQGELHSAAGTTPTTKGA